MSVGDRHYVFIDKKIRQVSWLEWAKWFEEVGNRRVAKTNLSNGICISTVFLGLDHQFGQGPPILFETMVFRGQFDGWRWRYCTYKESIIGHKRVVKNMRFLQRLKTA